MQWNLDFTFLSRVATSKIGLDTVNTKHFIFHANYQYSVIFSYNKKIITILPVIKSDMNDSSRNRRKKYPVLSHHVLSYRKKREKDDKSKNRAVWQRNER